MGLGGGRRARVEVGSGGGGGGGWKRRIPCERSSSSTLKRASRYTSSSFILKVRSSSSQSLNAIGIRFGCEAIKAMQNALSTSAIVRQTIKMKSK